MSAINAEITPAAHDKFLIQEMINLRDRFDIDLLIETGTWRGNSINIFCKHFRKCVSIESDKDCYYHAVEVNKNNPNVQLLFGNSPDILKTILIKQQKNTMFFLDAHWGDYWPLLDELQTISDFNIKPIIAIHDFFTPDENGFSKFGYDKYGNQPLDLHYVSNKMAKIYGEDGFLHYCLNEVEVNSGVGFFIPENYA
jgi:hypothetical protein